MASQTQRWSWFFTALHPQMSKICSIYNILSFYCGASPICAEPLSLNLLVPATARPHGAPWGEVADAGCAETWRLGVAAGEIMGTGGILELYIMIPQWLATPWLAITFKTCGVEHHILPKHGSPFGWLDYRTADTRCHFRGGYRRSHCWRGCERSKTRSVEWCVIQMLDCHPRAKRNRLAWRHFLLPSSS